MSRTLPFIRILTYDIFSSSCGFGFEKTGPGTISAVSLRISQLLTELATAVPPRQHIPLLWQGEMIPHCHADAHDACSLGKGCARKKQLGYLQNTNYDLYLLSQETLSLLHPIVVLLIFTSR